METIRSRPSAEGAIREFSALSGHSVQAKMAPEGAEDFETEYCC